MITGNNVRAFVTGGAITGLLSNLICRVTNGVLFSITVLVEDLPVEMSGGGNSVGNWMVNYKIDMFKANPYARDRFHRKRIPVDIFHKKTT